MEKQTIIKKIQFNTEQDSAAEIRHTLDVIELKLDLEIAAKQKTIEWQEVEIQRLHTLTEEKNTVILQLNDKLADCNRSNEGNRQLINKLLNDIDRLQQDIEWYKRTYQTRSFLGTIAEKIVRRNKK